MLHSRLQVSCTRVSLELKTFDFKAKLSEENVSGVVGNCQSVAIQCFEHFLVGCYADASVF